MDLDMSNNVIHRLPLIYGGKTLQPIVDTESGIEKWVIDSDNGHISVWEDRFDLFIEVEIIFDPDRDEALTLLSTTYKRHQDIATSLNCQCTLRQIANRDFQDFDNPKNGWKFFPKRARKSESVKSWLCTKEVKGDDYRKNWARDHADHVYRNDREVKPLTATDWAKEAYRLRDAIALKKAVAAQPIAK